MCCVAILSYHKLNKISLKIAEKKNDFERKKTDISITSFVSSNLLSLFQMVYEWHLSK